MTFLRVSFFCVHVDHWMKMSDEDAFHAVQRLVRAEGLLSSSGSALHGALAWLTTDGLSDRGSQCRCTLT